MIGQMEVKGRTLGRYDEEIGRTGRQSKSARERGNVGERESESGRESMAQYWLLSELQPHAVSA